MPRKPKPHWLPIRTDRLILREFRDEDFDAVHAYGSDPEVSRYMVWGPNTPADTRAFLDRMLAEQQPWPRTAVSMAVEHRGEGRLIGACRLWVTHARSRTAEMGYTFARPYWGQGFGQETARAVLACAFQVAGLRRVVSTCDVRNRRSWGVMEKVGMRREGCFRKDVRVRGRWRDTYLYALLAEEWRGL
jgi:ribosomal-protein-alanine N-acetyltransferase